jgi:DNA recombination protein RmuC
LQSDPTLPEYALKHRVALLSPANFLATVRTVASVWRVQKQNTNAQDIARRATQLDAGLVEKAIGDVLEEDGHLRLVKEGDED